MRALFEPSKAQGTVCAPPSKSEAHRYLIASALSKETSVVHGIIDSDDMWATIDCIRDLGIYVKREDDTVVVNAPLGENEKKPRRNWYEGKPVFNCLESGSTLRFFIPIALVLCGGGYFRCEKRLVKRGVEVYTQALEQDGVEIECYDDGIFAKGKLKGGKYTLRGDVSSQYISGLIFALPLLEKDSEIEILEPFESKNYVDMTINVLSKFGIEIQRKSAKIFSIKGCQVYHGGEWKVEGDWSNAAFLLALNQIGGNVNVEGLDEDSLQGDKACKDIFKKLDEREPVIDLANCPDLAPIAFVVASLKNGAKFVNTRRLKIKESSRADAMAEELARLGIVVDVHENDVYVHKSDIKTTRNVLWGHKDHRIIMALSVLLSKTGGMIDGIDYVAKSYPNFFEDIAKLGVKYDFN